MDESRGGCLEEVVFASPANQLRYGWYARSDFPPRIAYDLSDSAPYELLPRPPAPRAPAPPGPPRPIPMPPIPAMPIPP
eukprot:CAMPEP_0196666232 /NCGR_PEP_ID=MMETSP1086-20130531/64390_1 /TAXON_ID=77921 /ORGANISM="Cyanoptyche  gloeocystis , Strain SAG4.97" /LENGTH=78 /DNA_ID=CAMNT_0042003393 /DNA_START=913 /DNA_END=1146 /DNA_ORIENTATION=+